MAALGRPGYINLGHNEDLKRVYDPLVMEKHASEVLDLAYKHGIRYFDVARSYGKGEEFLANWINNLPDKRSLIVGSKWGYTYTAGWKVQASKHEVKEHSLEVLQKQYPQSQKNLGENLKIYHIHSATPDSKVLENPAVIERLWELKRSGIIPGLSLSGTSQGETLEKAMTIQRDGVYLFQSVQVTWNILEQSTTEILKKAQAAGFGIIVKESLANGRLTARNSEASFADKKAVLDKLSAKYQVGIDALSMAFVLKQPWVSVVLSGAATKQHLLSNLQANEINISEEDIKSLAALKETPEVYWNKRASLEWN
ncbi:aldo/keto reductase [Cytophagaceae bacterium ABcell3]|nr:aldo/keto reductase [Cytophagaceae bacterium ABcell3]